MSTRGQHVVSIKSSNLSISFIHLFIYSFCGSLLSMMMGKYVVTTEKLIGIICSHESEECNSGPAKAVETEMRFFKASCWKREDGCIWTWICWQWRLNEDKQECLITTKVSTDLFVSSVAVRFHIAGVFCQLGWLPERVMCCFPSLTGISFFLGRFWGGLRVM